MHELRRPRRIAATLAIFGLLAGGGVVGFAGATDDEVPTPPSFQVHDLKSGDRGVYSIDGRERPESDAARTGEFRFEIRPRGATVDADGLPRIVDEIMFADDRFPTKTNWDYPVSKGLQVDAATGEPLANIEEWTEIEEEGREVGDARTIYFLDTGVGGSDSLPCGLRSPLQGRSISVGDNLTLPKCMGLRYRDAVNWQVVEEVGSDGNATRIALWQAHPALPAPRLAGHLWYTVGIAYPVNITMYDRHGEVGLMLELQAFEAGLALLRDPAPVAPVIPRDAPRTPWMFDETGIEHPFPASEAVEVAMGDAATGTAEFLQQNPTAYIVDASYWEFDRGDGLLDFQWRLTWRDADSIHHVNVNKKTGQAADPATGILAGLMGTEPGPYTVSQGNGRDLGSYGEFYPAPATLPTVASMWAYYDAWAPHELRGKGPNMWEWSILGRDGGNRIIIEAGRFQDRPQSTDVNEEYSRDWAFLEYEWQDRHTPFRFSDRGFVRTSQPVATVPPQPWHLATIEAAPLRSLSAGEVTAIGGGALFVALAYHFWPLAKAAVGLFSRVGRDDVLEHPIRRRIYDYILANPGCHYQAVVRDNDVSKGTAQHHLAKLAATGHVVSARNGGYRCYFVRGQVDQRAMAASGVLKSPIAQAILATCQEEPGIRTGELAARLGVTAATISYHLRRLGAAGLLEPSGRGHGVTETGQGITA